MTDTVPRPNEHEESQGAMENPLVLQQWKFLDWRFLLPELQPRTLGYGGALNPGWVDALQMLDPDAVRVMEHAAPTRRFETVLLVDPDARLFRNAAESVQPGGWLCILARRSLRNSNGPRTLLGWKRLLERQGFQEISVNWFAPTLDFPSRIVPVGSRTSVLDTLRRHKGVRFGRLKQLAGRVALDLGLFAAAIPEGQVTGRRAMDERIRESLH